MGYLFWQGGRSKCPPCSSCGSIMTSEKQDIVQGHPEAPRIRVISVHCYECGQDERIGTYRYLGGHSFERIGL